MGTAQDAGLDMRPADAEPPAMDTAPPDAMGGDDLGAEAGVSDSGPSEDIGPDAAPPEVCGDGVTAGDEACDDGNAETEVCDYGQMACEVCAADCTLHPGETAFCGDGTLNGEEACDHGPANGGRGCDAQCALNPCGMLDYRALVVRGWRACLAGPFEREAPALSQEVLDALDEDLGHIIDILPVPAIDFLRRVTIWIEQAHPAFIGAVYHPSPRWLTDNGYPPEWGEGVMLGNARNYLDWTDHQPAMVLHEMAHAWHHQRLTYEYAPAIAAYEAAMNAGLYDEVAYVLGGTQRAYATNDFIEYFAELTEAWYWQNDFYPFDRADLLEHDPVGARLIQDAWAPF